MQIYDVLFGQPVTAIPASRLPPYRSARIYPRRYPIPTMTYHGESPAYSTTSYTSPVYNNSSAPSPIHDLYVPERVVKQEPEDPEPEPQQQTEPIPSLKIKLQATKNKKKNVAARPLWTSEGRRILVNSVRDRPHLWDSTSPGGKTHSKEAWIPVADVVLKATGTKYSAEDCKVQFRNMNEFYRKKKRQIEKMCREKGTSVDEVKVTWEFWEPLQFLSTSTFGIPRVSVASVTESQTNSPEEEERDKETDDDRDDQTDDRPVDYAERLRDMIRDIKSVTDNTSPIGCIKSDTDDVNTDDLPEDSNSNTRLANYSLRSAKPNGVESDPTKTASSDVTPQAQIHPICHFLSGKLHELERENPLAASHLETQLLYCLLQAQHGLEIALHTSQGLIPPYPLMPFNTQFNLKSNENK